MKIRQFKLRDLQAAQLTPAVKSIQNLVLYLPARVLVHNLDPNPHHMSVDTVTYPTTEKGGSAR